VEWSADTPLSVQDAAIFCLGVYTGDVPDAEFCNADG